MATRIFSQFDTTATNVVADVQTKILTSDAWSNPAGQRVVAQTTRGADMVVDLADAAATALRMQLGVYRTTGLADKLVRYIDYRSSGGTTSDPLHVTVSAGKEHLWISISGPYTGEANAESSPARDQFFIGDFAPYFDSDTVAAVVLAANSTTTPANDHAAQVSRNAADNASWVSARLGTVAFTSADSPSTVNLPVIDASDGNAYVWPFVVVESTAGIRGRVTEVFHLGRWGISLPGVGELSKLTIGTKTYIAMRPVVAGNHYSAWGVGASSGSYPLIAVPFS